MKQTSRLSILSNFVAVGALGAMVAAAGCGDNSPPVTEEPPTPPAPTLFAYALGTDYASPGILSRVEVLEPSVLEDVVSGVAASDPVLVAQGEYLMVVNRFGGDSVTVLKSNPLQLLAQVSVGAGSNPQDVAQVGWLTYVPVYGANGLVVIDSEPTDVIGGVELDEIDLSELDPFDGLPDCSAVLPDGDGDGVLVICQRLEAFAAVKPAVVVRASLDQAPTAVELAELNPNTLMVKTPANSFFGGDILVGAAPSYVDQTEGCLIAIDPVTLENECIITNAALGGSAIRMAVSADEATLWVAVSISADFMNPAAALVPIDMATGVVGEAISAEGQNITDVAACSDGRVLATDSAPGNKGLRIFYEGQEVTVDVLDIGLPPAFTNALVCY